VIHMPTIEEIKGKVKRYLQEKCNLNITSCYAVAKDLEDDFWDEWRNGTETELESQEDFSEFDGNILAQHPTIPAQTQVQQPVMPNPHNPDMQIQVT
jgi:hypothetical protein